MSDNLNPDMYNLAMPDFEAQDWSSDFSLFDNPEFIDFIGPGFRFDELPTGIE